MINQFGQWIPDYQGQQMYQDPAYLRIYQQQNGMRNNQQPMAQTQTQIQPQIQNGGFVTVRNEAEARNWAIAPGNSVTFKDESAPYIYTKTMGYNQLETPRFERFRLVKEEDAPITPMNVPETPVPDAKIDMSAYALKADLDAFKAEINDIKKSVEKISNRRARTEKENDE